MLILIFPPHSLSLPLTVNSKLSSATRTRKFPGSSDHLSRLLELLQSPPCWRLARLELSSLNLFPVSPALLTSVLTGLEEVDLKFARLTASQLTALLAGITPASSLRQLDLSGVDLSKVQPHLVAAAVCNLREVNITGTNLSQDKLSLIFSSIMEREDLRLEKFSLSNCSLSSVSAPVLSTVLSKLKSVSLHSAQLSPEQVAAVAADIQLMDHLDLSYNDLSSLPADLAAEALCRAGSLNISGSALTSSQTNSIFQLISNKDQNTNLTNLDICNNNLSSISPDILSKVAAKLHQVNFNQTCLSSEQVTFLQNNLPTEKVKNIAIQGRGENANDCSSLVNSMDVDILLKNYLASFEL